jgi:hypothetical protein
MGYLVCDCKGHVFDLRNYATELFAFDDAFYGREERRALYAKRNAIYDTREADHARRYALYEGKPWWGYFRRIRTTQERRFACIPEYRQFVRGRRSVSNLPDAYDDLYFKREKSWKSRVKVRRQWASRQDMHMDTFFPVEDISWLEPPDLVESA